MRPTTKFRSFLTRDGITLLPTVGDPFMARMAAREGYEAIGSSGNATAAMRLGMPDMGLLTLPENADNARRIAEASGLPVFADADTGYGNPLNVRRTVREFEHAGVASIMIEDQVSPKRCGMLAGKRLIPSIDMEAKIRAAAEARRDADFVIVGRTDARSVEGLDAAIARARAYGAAGADAIFLEGPRDASEVTRIAKEVGKPLLYNLAPSGATPRLPAAELARLGYKLLSFSVFALLAAMPAVKTFFAEFKRRGDINDVRQELATFDQYLELLGYPEMRAIDERYATPEPEAKP